MNAFKSTPTSRARGGGTRVGCGGYLLGLFSLLIFMAIGGAVWQPITYIGVAVFAGFNVLALWSLLFGKFNRQGACPHCGTTIAIFDQPEAKTKCKGCEHRLIMRGERLYDVTADSSLRSASAETRGQSATTTNAHTGWQKTVPHEVDDGAAQKSLRPVRDGMDIESANRDRWRSLGITEPGRSRSEKPKSTP